MKVNFNNCTKNDISILTNTNWCWLEVFILITWYKMHLNKIHKNSIHKIPQKIKQTKAKEIFILNK